VQGRIKNCSRRRIAGLGGTGSNHFGVRNGSWITESQMISILQRIVRRIIRSMPAATYPLYAAWQSRSTRALGFPRGILAISFDNDYVADNQAAERLLPLFAAHKMLVTWCVVGRWVERFESLHRRMLSDGHELANHSWSHPDNSELRPGDPRKFNELNADEVALEIQTAHSICLDRLGYRMRGFRLPHFRQHPAAPGELIKLGYKYTSNFSALRSPTMGIPYRTQEGLIEIPLAGLPRRPERMVETYRLFRSPDGLYRDEKQFYTDFRQLVRATAEYRLVSCLYLDACDVVRLSTPAFSKYLEVMEQENVAVLTMGALAEAMRV
jgi:hypothetical protein